MSGSILKKGAALMFAGAIALTGCKGDRGPAGPPGQGAAAAPPGAGLQVGIVSATAPAAGPATVTFTVKDAAGTPVDFLAELLAGNFGATRGPRFSIAQASAGGGTYDQALYETDSAGDPSGKQTRPTQVPASISLTDAAALYTKNADGSYTFTFPIAAPALPTLASGFPIAPVQSAQTLVGMQAARTFEGIQYPAGASFEFIPAGGTVTPRQVVSDAACNNCHRHLTAHGTRRTVGLCLTCHTPGWVLKPSANATANAIDFRVLVHQIHRGQQPTDVQNAKPYVYKWSATNDFSTVAFAPPNTVRNCVFCHQGGAQSDNWKTKPSRAACGSCHYAVDFATGAGHAGGLAAADDTCAACHHPDDTPPLGAAPSITKVHSFLYDALTNTSFTGADLGVTIDAVDVTTPAAGTVKFTVTLNGAPADIKATPLANLRFTIAGPTTDYGGPKGPVAGTDVLGHAFGYIQTGNFGGAGAALLTATGTPGQFTAPLVTLSSATPPVATPIDLTPANGQTVGVGVEAYVLETGTCPTPPCAQREWAQRPLPPTATSPTGVIYARVGGGTATPRRLITDAAKCNVCHEDLGFHGGEARKGPDYCAMCHNSQNVNDERTSQFEVDPATGQPFTKTPGTVQLSVMIHRIHKGSEIVPQGSLPSPRPTFTLGATRDFRANPATGRAEGEAPPVEFSHAFPGDLENCQTCHLPGGYGLPEPTVLPTRFVTFTCKEDPSADANAVCGTLSASGGVVAPDTAAGDAYWNKTETFVGSGRAHCGSCHDGIAADAHISLNTINGVESCDVCHGDGRFMDPIEIHQPRP
ncbi:OmcA/MtrC family decaheme c-type cytochrome [Anaeromyxobacter sp. SG66]|uniref:OmcA/MtrC family decaheme c-type cytochrome n=1 Tax=Anaeromyxobacter sp. SG66 TaxID=2925410 RepID=UPI001F5ACA9F|nr:OmcA/MtrC family decaheme c-type cytochrome [Anaeromyxobacter sp. SG66]